MAVSEGHERAIVELLEVMGCEATQNAQADAMVEASGGDGPEKRAFRIWVDRYLSFRALLPLLVPVYADQLSEEEVREVTAMYRTDVRQKALRLLRPEFVARTAALGVAIYDAHKVDRYRILADVLSAGSPS